VVNVTVYALPPRQNIGLPTFDVTTHGDVYRPLSPMLLGPVPLYSGRWSQTMENAWQFAKLYPAHSSNMDQYWPWAQAGWDDTYAHRYPMGKGARSLCSLWAGDRLDYVAARQRIYIPLYAQAVRFHALAMLAALRIEHAQYGSIVLRDFDAYDHRALGYSWSDVISDPDRKMGHGFVLAMMLEGVL
jgi:hypothetical protein